MSSVGLKNLFVHYGHAPVIDGISLQIPKGTFLTLLGPSGCGKTTLLRSIAGFVRPNAGTILFDNRDVTALAANQRNTGMVFQNFALFPHLTVGENVAFGLRVRRVSKLESQRRVKEALSLVSLQDFSDRRPHQLSGGQQQRVALARAVVIRPDVLLMDEPLSALDANLRTELQNHIRDVQLSLGVTTVYVTHDQGEALRMSDQIAVLNAGRVEQIAAPNELYRRPKSAYVARFIGQANLFEVQAASVSPDGRRCEVRWSEGQANLTVDLQDGWFPAVGATYKVGIRPERVSLVGNLGNEVPARVEKIVYSGSSWNARFYVQDRAITIEADLRLAGAPPAVGERVTLTWSPGDCFIIEP